MGSSKRWWLNHETHSRVASSTIVNNTCRTPHAAPDSPTFNVLTIATPHHQRALALINAIHL